MALVTLEGHSVWPTPISRGRVSHSDSGLNTVGGVLSYPWFVNDWHSLRIMPLSDVEKKEVASIDIIIQLSQVGNYLLKSTSSHVRR